MTDNMNASTINDLLRSLASWLIDRPAYLLLGWMYEIFFNVASAELFTNATVKNFYYRVQLIIGVFMIFKLAISILQGIMNPDKVTDKQAGMGNMVTRVIISLAMLTVLVPINIPNATNEYEIELNNNGLLFGTLYSLQNRILSNNTLGRLILGTTDDATDSSDKQGNQLKQSANVFASTILKGFIRINMIPENSRQDPGEGKDPETLNENRVCQDISDDILKLYTQLDVDPQELLGLVNIGCTASKDASWWGESLFNTAVSTIKKLASAERYAFAYIPLLGGIVAFVFAFVLLGFTVDIAVRAVKLAVLRLIAPIPIISYIDPKSAKDGAFASWVKAVTSTYLDIFIRLAIIYFVIFLIQDMIVNGIVINTGTGIIGIISFIFICLGLFFFARQAPKFIKDTLGLKGNMGNIGVSALLGGTAMALGGGGLRGFGQGLMQGAESSVQGYNQGKPQSVGSAWSQNRDMMAKIRTGDKDARGGIIGTNLDKLNFYNREKQAEMLGIGRNDAAVAKYNKDRAEEQARRAQKAFKFAEQNLNAVGNNPGEDAAMLSATHRNDDGTWRDTGAQKRYEKQVAWNRAYSRAHQSYNDAYDTNEKAQAAAAKAGKIYDSIDKDRGIMGVAPRVSDSRRSTYRSARKVITASDMDGFDTAVTDVRGTTEFTNSPSEFLYENDTKFTGVVDDSAPGTFGHGAGGGPGPGGPPPGP